MHSFGTDERAGESCASWNRVRGCDQVFDGPTLEKVDDRFDYGETRVYAIGVVNGLEITLIYADVSETERRVMSAWRAERHERAGYWQSLG